MNIAREEKKGNSVYPAQTSHLYSSQEQEGPNKTFYFAQAVIVLIKQFYFEFHFEFQLQSFS